MTAGTILRAIETYLRPVVAEVKGICDVAETEWDALQNLAVKPEGFRVVLTWTKAKNADGKTSRSGITTGTLSAYFIAGKGLEAKPGDSFHRTGTGGSLAFIERFEWVIKMLRALEFDHDSIDCEENLAFQGYEVLKFDDKNIARTARADFEILYALDDPTGESGIDPVTLYGGITFTISGGYLLITKNGVTRKVRLLEV
jgi:hypothetical protein